MPMNRPGKDEKEYNKTRMITRLRIGNQIGHIGYDIQSQTLHYYYT
jgi:hypothetical protein